MLVQCQFNMKRIFIVLFCLISLVSKAQVYQEMPQYGYRANRMAFDSTLQIPTVCGVPTLKSVVSVSKKAAIAFDSCNNKLYQYNPKTLTWSEISGGTSIDTTSLSNRINLKLNISDTANKWVNAVTLKNDSSFYVIKGTTTDSITIRGVSYAAKLKTQVWNNTGVTITKGSVVYISGKHSSNLATIALAEGNNEANSYKTFALVENDIVNNSSGYVIQSGKIENLNLPTATYTDGDILYLSATVAGGYTIIKPLAPDHICKLGSVTRAHPTLGSIEVKIENGWQLDELSDVKIAVVPNDSTLLQFSRVDSLWHDVSVTNAIGTKYLKPTDTASLSSRINTKQTQLNGTGFVKASGTTISYDNSTYVTTITTQNISGDKTFTGVLKSTHYGGLTLEGTGSNGDANGINFKQYAGNVAIGYPYNLFSTRDSTAFLFWTPQSSSNKSFYLDLSHLSLNTGYNVYVQNKEYTLADSADVAVRVKYTDTATMLSPYLRKVDTASLSSRINLKVNISDTSTMLTKYLRKTDTATLSSRIDAKGYALNLGGTSATVNASTTYYFGSPAQTITNSAAIRRVYIPQSGTIKGGQIYVKTTNITTTETWTLSVRLNNSSNTTFASLGNALTDKVFATSALSIAVVAGDYIEITTTTPAFVTAPGSTYIYGSIFIQ